MSAPAAVEQRLQALRQKLGRKQHFEEAVADLAAAVVMMNLGSIGPVME